MAGRLLDVLNDEEKDLQGRVATARSELDAVEEQLAASARQLGKATKELTDLKDECKEVGARIEAAVSRGNPEAAEKAYQANKPDRYDVTVYFLKPQNRGGGKKRVTGYVKMYWGNRVKIIFEGDPGMAETVAQKVLDLTGQSKLKVVEVNSKQAIWDS